MAIALGSRLGAYEVVSSIGAGGMGEVYLARDTRLQRDVAIKVLPAAFAADPDRLARFEREAQTLASLNHPHVAQIYGVVDVPAENGTPALQALVMEFVPGEDLSQRIARGAVPVAEALPLAMQIADALEAAHERGIVHRDLKPANIKLAPDGTVKVLDFGLAKAIEGAGATGRAAGPSRDVLNSPTFTSPAQMTQMGVILGTAAYMAPEQARGKGADRRSDLWAFGVVLYEMLTGRTAFEGETVTDVLAAIVTREPDWSALPADAPPAIRRLLQRCLTRDPRRRLSDAGEARYQIEESLSTPVHSPPAASTAAPSSRRRVRSLLPWLVAAACAAVAAIVWLQTPPRDGADVIRYSIEAPPKATVNIANRPALAISPDGKSVAFVATIAGTSRIYVRAQQDFEARPLAGTEGGSEPVFSPDSQSLAFFAENRLSKIAVAGGPVETLATVNDPRGLSWDSDRIITFSPQAIGGVFQVALGEPTTATAITKPTGEERTHRWAQALADNKAVLFTVGNVSSPDNYDDATIEAVILASGERRVVLKGAAMARYVAPGYLVYVRNRVLFGVRFDPDRLQVEGSPVVLLQGIAGDWTTGAANFSSSSTGTLAYFPGSAEGAYHRLMWADRSGLTQPIDVPRGTYFDVRLSPDGGRLALQSIGGGVSDIWVHDFARKTFTRLTFGGSNRTPVWSRDGTTIYYVALDARGARVNTIMRRPADGSRAAEAVATTTFGAFLSGVSADERSALINFQTNIRKTDIGTLALQPDAALRPLVESNFDEYCAALSPNGRWLAYQSDETSRFEIYVRDIAGGGRWQISTQGGEEPHWSADGRELYFRNGTELMMSSVQTDGTFQNQGPRLLFDGIYDLRAESGISYDVDPKGNRFVMIRLSDPAVISTSIRVVTNWSAELTRLLREP